MKYLPVDIASYIVNSFSYFIVYNGVGPPIKGTTMRLCSIENLREGMIVARPVYDDRLDFLLSAGQELSKMIIARLRKLEVFDLYIEEPGTEDIAPPVLISQKTRRRAHRFLKRTFDKLMDIAELSQAAQEDVMILLKRDRRYQNTVRVNSLRDIIKQTLDDLISNNAETFEVSFMNSYLNYNYEHALNTMILSLVIARGFQYSQEELMQLGLAALLHDIGKMVWPDLAKKRRLELEQDDAEMLKKHPIVGARILDITIPDSAVEQAGIRDHHERQDGKGYPNALVGSNREPIRHRVAGHNEIFRMAEIIAVANAFDNLQRGEYSEASLAPVQAAETIVHQAGTLFNKTVVSKAISLINVYPIGAVVTVKFGNNHVPVGTRGVVRRVASENLKRPEVIFLWNRKGHRISPQVVDLDAAPDIQIELV